ncbi:transporter suffix domain-containing protein [Enemella evansiae]|uniref:transporter suffix domain-containing protein n=1 Tax=Enemella evansiae TaxID=2016499 RepID=UPI0011404568|nr:transporter suffix domain-containing protein [Enemella evansiae]
MTTTTRSRPAPAVGAKKPLRFKIGIGLLILYPFFYLVIPIAAFLAIDAGLKVAIVGGVLAAAEVVLLAAIACVGKEAFQAIKAKIFRKKLAAEEPATEGAGHAR